MSRLIFNHSVSWLERFEVGMRVLMFVPIEGALAAALTRHPELFL